MSSGRSRCAFVEVVWGDGKKIDRQVIPATDLGAFGTKHFAIPFDATGQGVGAVRGVGLGRQRRVRAADVAGAEGWADAPRPLTLAHQVPNTSNAPPCALRVSDSGDAATPLE